jgi:preprotein translocase subunit SecE
VKAAITEKGAGTTAPSHWSNFRQFFRDSWLELKKVMWPTHEAVAKMTGLVIAVVAVVGMFMYAWDQILSWTTGWLFKK